MEKREKSVFQEERGSQEGELSPNDAKAADL